MSLAFLGTFGHTFPIAEESMLDVLTKKLSAMEADGTLEAHQEKIRSQLLDSARNPKSLGYPIAKSARSYVLNPSIKVSKDIVDHEQKVIVKAGTYNPLDKVSLSVPLVFIDAGHPESVTWLKSWLKDNGTAKVILTGGNPFDLEKELGIPVYFDQMGKITKKLRIEAVPAVVIQDGKMLRINEFNPITKE